MRFGYLFILGLLPCINVNAQNLFSKSVLKSKIDSASSQYPVSSDLLPPEFNASALENEYYCDSAYFGGHVFVLRLRDNNAFIYEIYYKPYNWARISYRIGNYRISGDTVHITYKQLLEGKPDAIYLQPTLSVSWVTPRPPAYLLLNKGRLVDPFMQRHFYTLTEKPQFELGKP
jgi:hypothetical protein